MNDFFTRCQGFFIELCSLLKLRLPFKQEIFRSLTFLGTEIAINSKFHSLSQLLEKISNVVLKMLNNVLTMYKEWKFYVSVQSLLASSGNINGVVANGVNNFLIESGKDFKYLLLTKVKKQFLCLPVSNVKCEQIFLDFYRIKTKENIL